MAAATVCVAYSLLQILYLALAGAEQVSFSAHLFAIRH